MKRLALVLLLAGCASMRPIDMSPDVRRLEAFAASFQRGWRVEVWPAETPWNAPGYLVTMVGQPGGYYRWFSGDSVNFYTGPTIYLRDQELAATRCADLAIAQLFARRQERIPFTFAQQHVAKEAVKLLVARGWTDADVRAARASCPTNEVSTR